MKEINWILIDHTQNVTTRYGPKAGATINSAHSYTVCLQVSDPDGIKQVSTWAEGKFQATAETPDGQEFWAPFPLPASLPTKSKTFLAGTTFYTLEREPFVYHDLDCGVHIYNGMSTAMQFTPVSGTLQFHGSEVSFTGQTIDGLILNLTP